MSTTKHTAGPWRIHDARLGMIVGPDFPGMGYVAQANQHRNNEERQVDGPSNAARIVACVNACEGITDPVATIKRMRAVLKRYESGEELTDGSAFPCIDQEFGDLLEALGD